MNTNSNTYTVIYASVVVIVVAFLMAFVAASLKEKQDENVVLDKKKQILSALNVDTKDKDAAQLYKDCVKYEYILNTKGDTLATEGGFSIDVKVENSKPLEKRQLPLYVCNIDGATKYVIPMRGAGLWGPIWGYIALNDDKNTVFGVYFSHESETPGLGAEIVMDIFKKPFHGKHIKQNGSFTSIAVVKPGKTAKGLDYVDGISGGTMTSQGVNNMLKEGMGQYVEFLNK
jgi:Na+-transporting NADH:ubiquinone oxidoreductase subunit C